MADLTLALLQSRRGVEAVPVPGVMVNSNDWEVHPKMKEWILRTQKRCMGYVAIVVDDYDRAIEYYTEKLGFTVVEDTPQAGKRWVVVTPNPESDCNLLLARASTDRQEVFIGNQCGGRVFLFLHTDDFWRDYGAMKAAGVHFCEEPRQEEYGTVVVFEDLYGNRWDLYQNKW